MAYSEAVADRVRAAVSGHEVLSERKMFGGLCFMINGNMFAGLIGEELMLRVGPDRFEEALARPGARLMDFTGRPMHGYVYVEPRAFAAEGDLRRWLEDALSYVESLPPKQATGKRKPRRQA